MIAATKHFTMNGPGITDLIRLEFLSAKISKGIEIVGGFTPEDPDFSTDTLARDLLKGTKSFYNHDNGGLYLDDAENEDLTIEIFQCCYRSGISEEDQKKLMKILEIADEEVFDYLSISYRSDEAMEDVCCWITEQGNFLNVGYSQHESLLYEMVENFKLELWNPVAEIEKKWVRVSIQSGLGRYCMQFTGNELNKKQEEAIFKYLELNPDFMYKGKFVNIAGYGEIWEKNGKLVIIKNGEGTMFED